MFVNVYVYVCVLQKSNFLKEMQSMLYIRDILHNNFCFFFNLSGKWL